MERSQTVRTRPAPWSASRTQRERYACRTRWSPSSEWVEGRRISLAWLQPGWELPYSTLLIVCLWWIARWYVDECWLLYDGKKMYFNYFVYQYITNNSKKNSWLPWRENMLCCYVWSEVEVWVKYCVLLL